MSLDYETPRREAEMGDRVRAVVAGFLGWTLDAFDFFLVVFTSRAVAEELHVERTAIVFAAVTATLAGRPLGAIIFGLMADRFGRRLPLMINLVFYSMIEVATGFSPNYGVFLLLRFLFGVGMGGEWGVGASLMMEKVSPKWRGMLSGMLQEGYALGNLLATMAYGLLYPHLDGVIPGFSKWRVLFFLGGVPALLALFVRYGIKESEVWEETRSANWSHWFGTIRSHWKLLLFIVVMMAMFNSSSHGTQDLYPAFLEDRGLEHGNVTLINGIGSFGAIVGGVLVGLWSDKIGRRKAIVAAFMGALVCIPLWAFAPHGNLVLLGMGAFLMQFMVQGAWGVVPAHLTELTPDNVRGFLPGFGYQCGCLIAGTLPWIQESLQHHGRARVMASTCGIVFVLAAVVVASGWERKGVVFGGKNSEL